MPGRLVPDLIEFALFRKSNDDDAVQEVIERFGGHQTALEFRLAEQWLESGLPRVSLGHRHAAALMATRTSADVLSDLELPWECFSVSIPNGLLVVTDHPDGPAEVLNAFFWKYEDVAFLAAANDSQILFFVGTTRLSHAGEWDGSTPPEEASSENPWTRSNANESRVTEMLYRLLVGVCLELLEHRPSRPEPKASKSKSQRMSDVPLVWSVRLTRNIEVDCQRAVRAYCEGRSSSSPTVQCLVRGHWKQQAHGPGHSLRKMIFVAPYWKGPDDGPVAEREHIL